MSAIYEVAGAVEQPWPDELGDYLSASRLTLFQRCPEQYRRRYLKGERERANGNLIWGGADHYAHEQNFRQKITSHADLPVEDVKVAFAEGFDQRVTDGGGAGEIAWGGEKPGEVKDAGVLLAATYHTLVSPTVQPIAVETRFDVSIPGVPVPVIGYIDVNEALRAIERKTARAKTVAVKPGWRLQGLAYQYAKQQPVDFHVSVKTKTPAVYTADTEPGLRMVDTRTSLTERLFTNLADHMLALYTRFGPDDPWPGAITDDWACLYCKFGPKEDADCAWWT